MDWASRYRPVTDDEGLIKRYSLELAATHPDWGTLRVWAVTQSGVRSYPGMKDPDDFMEVMAEGVAFTEGGAHPSAMQRVFPVPLSAFTEVIRD